MKNDCTKIPLITVVTVVKNGEKFIEQTICSVINQTLENLEYIVIDGGSTDQTPEIIKKYENSLNYWISETDNGIYAAMNKGINKSTGEWIILVNSGDFLINKNILKEICRDLINIPQATNIVYGHIMLFTEKGKELFQIGQPWDKIKKRFNQVMSIPHPAVFHRRKLFLTNGMFDETFKIAGDYEILIKEFKVNQPIYLPIIITGMRQGGVSNQPNQTLNSLREVRRAQIINGITLPGFIWTLSVLTAYIRLMMFKIFSDKTARKLIDILRGLIGLPPCWTVDE